MSNRKLEHQSQSSVTQKNDLCQQCQRLSEYQRKIVEEMIEELLELDSDERKSFYEMLNEEGYGTVTLVYRAGNCVGMDWQNSHRTHET